MSATATAATAAATAATVEPWLPPPMVEIFVKTMTGDLLPLTVCNNACLEQIAQQITRTYPDYPVNRVRVFHLPTAELEEKEEKEHLHQEGDVLMMMVLDPPVKETGVWSDGEPYTRFAFPFHGNTVYVYVTIYHNYACYCVTKHSNIPSSPRELRHSGFVLYDLLTSYYKWITLEEIAYFKDVLFPYIDELGKENGQVYGHQFSPSEPRKCGCGSVVKRSGMTSHIKTKKHQTWLKTQ